MPITVEHRPNARFESMMAYLVGLQGQRRQTQADQNLINYEHQQRGVDRQREDAARAQQQAFALDRIGAQGEQYANRQRVAEAGDLEARFFDRYGVLPSQVAASGAPSYGPGNGQQTPTAGTPQAPPGQPEPGAVTLPVRDPASTAIYRRAKRDFDKYTSAKAILDQKRSIMPPDVYEAQVRALTVRAAEAAAVLKKHPPPGPPTPQELTAQLAFKDPVSGYTHSYTPDGKKHTVTQPTKAEGTWLKWKRGDYLKELPDGRSINPKPGAPYLLDAETGLWAVNPSDGGDTKFFQTKKDKGEDYEKDWRRHYDAIVSERKDTAEAGKLPTNDEVFDRIWAEKQGARDLELRMETGKTIEERAAFNQSFVNFAAAMERRAEAGESVLALSLNALADLQRFYPKDRLDEMPPQIMTAYARLRRIAGEAP